MWKIDLCLRRLKEKTYPTHAGCSCVSKVRGSLRNGRPDAEYGRKDKQAGMFLDRYRLTSGRLPKTTGGKDYIIAEGIVDDQGNEKVGTCCPLEIQGTAPNIPLACGRMKQDAAS